MDKRTMDYELAREKVGGDKTTMFIWKTLYAIWPALARLYLWRVRLWNMMMIGGTGYFIQLFCQLFFMSIGIVGKLFPLAVFLAVLIAFIFNYFFYENWVFRG